MNSFPLKLREQLCEHILQKLFLFRHLTSIREMVGKISKVTQCPLAFLVTNKRNV